MASSYTNNKKEYNFDRYVKNLKDVAERTVRTYHLRRFREVVAPFQSDIPFDMTIEEKGDKITIAVGVVEGATTGQTNAAGDDVLASDLWKWLDLGTSDRFVSLPDDFSNETSPGSLSTSSASYDRDNIKLDLNADNDGIEKREFTKQIAEENFNILRNRIRLAFNKGTRLL